MMSASTGRTGATCGGSAVTRGERRAAACVLVAAAAAFTAPADAATPYRFVGRPIAIVSRSSDSAVFQARLRLTGRLPVDRQGVAAGVALARAGPRAPAVPLGGPARPRPAAAV